MSNYRILPIGGGGGITPTGTLSITENGIYNVKQFQYADIQVEPSWLCFTALEDNSSVSFSIVNSYGDYEYSTDKITFNSWDGTAISLNEGDKLYVKGFYSDIRYGSQIGQFSMTGTISASGDITALLNEVGGVIRLQVGGSLFRNLFKNCSSLVKAPNIDLFTDFSGSANFFNSMFYGTGLTELPRLPHVPRSVGNMLYMFDNMFGNCQSLPAKPDFSYIDNTYWLACETYGMFEGSSIEEIALPSLTNIAMDYQFKRTFKNMTNLTKVDMSNLVSIDGPSHPIEECFKGCSNLSEIKIAVTTTWNRSRANHWMQGVASTGNFYNLSNNYTIPENDDSGIPVGWRNIVHDVAPTVILQNIGSVTSTSADAKYYIYYDGGVEITRYGVCWSTSSNPTVSNNHVDGTLPAAIQQVYTANLTGLSNGVTYYVRAYAQNEVGLSYSEERMFVAQDPPPTSPYIHKDTIDDFNGDALSTTYFLNNAVINTGIQATTNMSLRVKGKYMGKYESNTTVGTWNTNLRDASWRMFIRPDNNTTYYDVNYIRNYITLPELGEDIDYLISPDKIINMNTAVTICSTGQNALIYSIGDPILVDIYTWWVHSLEIFDDNGDTVFNGIAREQNGVVGLYDSVSQQMFTNSNINLVLEN